MQNSSTQNKKSTKNTDSQSTWKDFDSGKKDIRNVNYDFTSSAPSAPGSNVHVPRKNLLNTKLLNFGRGIRIYSIVLFVLCLAAGAISFFTNKGIAIPCVLVGLSTIHLVLVVVLYILIKKEVEYVPAMRNVYNPAVTISILALGLAIGGVFMEIYLHHNVLAIVQGFLILCTNMALMNLHSFKKTA